VAAGAVCPHGDPSVSPILLVIVTSCTNFGNRLQQLVVQGCRVCGMAVTTPVLERRV